MVTQPPRRVFISYASQDSPLAQRVCSALEGAGVSCWMAPRDVVPGTVYADAIVRAIDESAILVLILSERSVASAHVGKELERAAAKRHPIIALRTDLAPLNRAFQYFLNESQWIEVGAGGMESAMTRLIAAIERHFSAGSAAAPSPLTPDTRGRIFWSRRVWIGAGGLLALGLATAYVLTTRESAKGPATGHATAAAMIEDQSVAVLPFVDMSEHKDEGYFADGMSEELIDLLSRIPHLRVPARTSSFYFKGQQSTIANIAKVLGVNHVLEGSVRKSGKTLRVTAQLIRADNGFHVWSQTYDRTPDDIFKVQDEIAGAVVKELKASLLATAVVRSAPTENGEAYALYLQAKELFRHGQDTDYQSAYEDLQRALALDPQFAAAWSEIAWIRVREVRLGVIPRAQASREAHAAIEKALRLAPDLAEAHLTMGRILYVLDWDWQRAEREINRAMELDPGIADSYQWAGMVAITLGHPDRAMQLFQEDRGRDPLSPHAYDLSAQLSLRAGNFSAAQSDWAAAHALMPAMYDDSYIALVDLAQGRPDAALASVSSASDSNAHYVRARAYQMLGRKTDVDAELAALVRDAADTAPYRIAVLYALRGDRNAAFIWLDRAYAIHNLDLPFIKGDPDLKNIEADPRFRTFLGKMSLPE